MEQQLIIITTPEQLKEAIEESVISCLANLPSKASETDKGEDDLLQIDDVCKLLGKTRQTIHNWKRKGLIPFHRMGRRIYFKRSEIIESLQKVDLG